MGKYVNSKDTMFLYGKNPVIERLKADPASVRKVLLKGGFNDGKVLDLVKSTGVKAEHVPEKEFMKLKRADRVQGVIGIVDKFKYTDFDGILSRAEKNALTLVFLDNLSDPQNLGVIIRSAACFGGFAVVIPEHKSCDVTEAVLHVASGGENYVPVCKVTNLLPALLKAKDKGYWSVGTVTEGGEKIAGHKFTTPAVVVIGSEGKGIRPGLMKHIDFKVTLPMAGAGLSFNAAIAAAIFCYEITKQRG
jgi:23S rRNA (guanosine2251-2'-O)-methyltransferase